MLATRLAPSLEYLGIDPAKSVVGQLRRELPRAAFEVARVRVGVRVGLGLGSYNRKPKPEP